MGRPNQAVGGAVGRIRMNVKTLESIANSRKKFGEDSVFIFSDKPLQVGFVPTGSLGLDIAIGVGGIPTGRISEIFGPESSGKTTLCQHIIANAQRLYPDLDCGYIDMEHALDSTYMSACGINLDNLVISQPDNGEQALELAEAMIRSGGVKVIVIDSVA